MRCCDNLRIKFRLDLFLVTLFLLTVFTFLVLDQYQRKHKLPERLILNVTEHDFSSKNYKKFFSVFTENKIYDIENFTIFFKFKSFPVLNPIDIARIGEGADAINFVLLPHPISLGVNAKNVQAVFADLEAGSQHFVCLEFSRNGELSARLESGAQRINQKIQIGDTFDDIFRALKAAQSGDLGKTSDFTITINVIAGRRGFLLRNKLLSETLPVLFILLAAALLTILFPGEKYPDGCGEPAAGRVKKTDILYGLLAADGVMGIYNFLIFNRFFPVTEGWWSFAAKYILSGKMPYRDFYCPLVPGYPLTLAGFISLLGYDFLYLRILGVLLMLVVTTLVFLIFLKILPARIAVFSAIVTMFVSESFTFLIPYDFNILIFVYMFIAALFFYGYLETRGKRPKLSWINLSLAALSVSFLSLTKQNCGVLAFAAFIFLIILFNGKKFIIPFLNFCTAFFIPILIMLGWLAQNNALPAFWQQVFLDVTNEKGGLNKILFAWLPNLYSNTEAVNYLIINFSVLYALRYQNLFALKVGTSAEEGNIGKNIFDKKASTVFLLIFFSSSLAFMLPLVAENAANFFRLNHIMNYIYGSLPVTVTTFMLLWLGIYVFRYLSGEKNRQTENVLVFLVISTAVVLFSTTSAHCVSLLTSQLPLGLLLGLLVFKKSIFRLGRFLFICVGVFLIVMSSHIRAETLFSWWGVESSGIKESFYSSEGIKYLKGFYLDEKTEAAFREINQIVAKNTIPSDTIFVFPHMPVFYLMNDRYPATFAFVHWFDVASDRICRTDAARLKKTPPKVIIIWGDGSEYAMTEHEKGFRGGKPCGQREIIKVLHGFTNDSAKYRLEREFFLPGPGGSPIKVWCKIDDRARSFVGSAKARDNSSAAVREYSGG